MHSPSSAPLPCRASPLARTLIRTLASLSFVTVSIAALASPTRVKLDNGAAVDKVSAATQTATSTTNACSKVGAFYWELGDAGGPKAFGSVGGSTYTANTPVALASASKWLYGAYAAQRRPDLGPDDYRFLHMTSGYVEFTSCGGSRTVGACAVAGTNGVYTAEADGEFYYDEGHMQQHALSMGMGTMTGADLTAAIGPTLGISVQYPGTMIAGAGVTTPAEYAKFLRNVMKGSLRMSTLLGSNAVCTDPATCATALYSPLPEQNHYSIGHWVEDDPVRGDGAFSSPGAFGFYPWISADRSVYGIVAREMRTARAGWDPVLCGRAIRRAWTTGVVQ